MATKKIAFLLLFFSILGFSQDKKWTLEECINYALDNNITIQSSALDLQTSEINKKDAFGNFLPNINASVSHSWNIGLNQNITTGLLENQTIQYTSAGINVGVDIFKGLQNQNQLRRANLAIIASKYQLTKIKEDVVLNIASAYLQILFNKESLKVQEEQLSINQQQLNRTQELVDAGMVPRGDLLDIKATVASNNQAIILAKNNLMISKMSLAQLLKLEDFQNFDIAEEETEIFQSQVLNESFDEIMAKAKESRTELKLAESNLLIAEKDLAIAKGNYYPTIQGFYSFSTRASNADRFIGAEIDSTNPTSVIGVVETTGDNVVQPNYNYIVGKHLPLFDQFNDNKGSNLGLQVNIPIFNGLVARNNVARSKISLEKAKINLEQQGLDLERTVFTAYSDTQSAKLSYEAALETLEARQLSFNYAKERYTVGLMNIFDFNQAQTTLTNAESEVLRTKYDYIFKTKILEFYFGIPITQTN